MRQANHYVSKAKLDAATAAAVAASDAADGVIDDPLRCVWDPATLVETKVRDEMFTAADAEVLRQICDGARSRDGKLLWHGYLRARISSPSRARRARRSRASRSASRLSG